MENGANRLESGFRIHNILLLKQTFERSPKVTFDHPEIRHSLNVGIAVQVEGNKVSVTETVDFSQTFEGVVEYSLSIQTIGVFEFVGESSKLSLEEFGRVNGAAIIFPYVRENISSTCARAGLGAVILPPFDFTKHKATITQAKQP
jgi:preprotein translocase subunit SecB